MTIESKENNNREMDIYEIAQNRELSWLKFNERVLELAMDPLVPIYEKLKFIAVFTSNLDEFYMVRVGSLTDLSLLKTDPGDSKTKMTSKEQLYEIFKKTKDLYRQKDSIYKRLSEDLFEEGICEMKLQDLSKIDLRHIQSYYRNFIEPILSPMVIDSYHPFPFVENLQSYLIGEIQNDSGKKIGILPIPKAADRIFYFQDPDKIRYIRLEKIIKYYFEDVYSDWKILNFTTIRVTRNADLTLASEIADQDLDYRDSMKNILKKRKRLQAVRIETDKKLSSGLEEFLCKNLKIEKEQIFDLSSPMDMSYVYDFANKMDSELLKHTSFTEFSPQKNPKLDMSKKLLDQVREKDLLFIYPYEDINQFLALIEEAATDKDVVAIRIAIYRLSSNSKIAYSLMKAAENGKDVLALMELRARFDEQHNIDYSEALIEAGVKVIYGIENYKCHSKVCLIIKKGREGMEYISQIGTGNYNEKTAKQYTDISLITSDKQIAQDEIEFFNNMQMGKLDGKYKKLLQAPSNLKEKFLELIDKEISKGKDGFIFFKFNALTDKDFILKLAEASQKGVEIRLIIRGICCLVPGIEGLTQNIEVRSIVGRFLEHDKVYIFGREKNSKIYISSADLMTRNTTRRVEIACPIEDKNAREKILDYLNIQWQDNQKSRKLGKDKNYERIYTEEKSFSSQDYMMASAKAEVLDYREMKKEESTKSLWKGIKKFFKS